jgi:murein DD-endopeptidase MepM/ murein hydrolase activator NlpD
MKSYIVGTTAVIVIALALSFLLPDKPAPREVTIDIPLTETSLTDEELDFVMPDSDEFLADEDWSVVEESDTAALPAHWHQHQIASGDTLSAIFSELEIDRNLLYQLVNADTQEKSLSRLRPGQTLIFRFSPQDNRLEQLEHQISQLKTALFTIADDGISHDLQERDIETRIEMAYGKITASLFLDGLNAGLTDKVIIDMANLFTFDIDFARQIQPNDHFAVIYEARYLDGERIGSGDILAAEFINNGESLRAVRFENEGFADYYDHNGRSRKKAFIRTPLNFTRISSGFTNSRFHPVLKTWRSHRGVDYAAPTGTPVWATGNGVVKSVERQRGYGKVVFLQHGDEFVTVYAHLNAFKSGLKRGDRVKQGDVIGYVGQTGLATGPHLHYEFRIKGEHVDPLSYKLPAADPIKGNQLMVFQQHAEPLLQQLDLLREPTVASN